MDNKRALDRRLCRAVARLLVTMAWPPLGRSTRNTWQTRKQCARAALRRDFAHLGCAHANKLSPNPLLLHSPSLSLPCGYLCYSSSSPPLSLFSPFPHSPVCLLFRACKPAKYFPCFRDYAATPCWTGLMTVLGKVSTRR